jgi:hypothetical protein
MRPSEAMRILELLTRGAEASRGLLSYNPPQLRDTEIDALRVLLDYARIRLRSDTMSAEQTDYSGTA